MEYEISHYIKKMESFKEDDFTKEIVIPLFESMGYQRVEFNGGPFERGRDAIATIRIPPHKLPKVIYIQSKKIKNQHRAGTREISDLGHQIRQSCDVGFFSALDNKKLMPTEIYITTPNIITQRFHDELSGQFTNSVNIPIHVMDGSDIIDSIRHYCPTLLDKLNSIKDKITNKIRVTNGNQDLLNALKSVRKNVDVKQFYSDLSFFVGSLDSNILMHLEVELKDTEIELSQDEWIELRKIVIKLDEEHGIYILHKSIEAIESEFEIKQKSYLSENNQRLIIEEREIVDNLVSLKNQLSNIFKDTISLNSKIIISSKGDVVSDLKTISEMLQDLRSEYSESITYDIMNISQNLFSINPNHHKNLMLNLSNIKGLSEEIRFYEERAKELAKIILISPSYIVKANAVELSESIRMKKDSYRLSVEAINKKEYNFIQTKNFLTETEKTLSFLYVLRTPSLAKLIKRVNHVKAKDRVSISPLDVFATGHDIAVYGAAGVGKTTTLEAYYDSSISGADSSIILVQLNRLVSSISESPLIIHSVNDNGENHVNPSELVYRLILATMKVEVNSGNISELVDLIENSDKFTLILDGVDEIYNTIPKFFESINNFKEKHKNSQLIVSSRDCVSYLNKINFLGITLLPFSAEQINRFVRGWFATDVNLADELLTSIYSKNLYEYVKTPLMLTITCSLVEKGVDAPSSETEIYDKRLNLLTGEYDKVKNIERQTNSGELLRKVASRLAYLMHKRRVRELSKIEIVNSLSKEYKSRYSEELIESIVNDLIDPCNILILDRYTHRLSFGHFRFQEHLAAKELTYNRGIEISELTDSDWWRGTLCLYAQENDIEFLINEVYQKFGSIRGSEITFKEMAKHTAPNRRKIIESMIVETAKLDLVDELYTDSYVDEDLTDYIERNSFDRIYEY
ncbi:hypothetical protein MJ923_13730 [Shewanella sp. 3B26]|uniref:NACHT domain-containing protein n=1 Tax=Shewanella zhuhaiensis TaxID=2919576 RepID=A0AAJ1BIM6_9GAMM|nr:hypothetical protein [Shewanella zhuhaiensis]MCH4295366.1 hypothetical protein [Shewanella zhuhaiensis]